MKSQTVKFSVGNQTVREIELPVSRESEIREQNQAIIAQHEQELKAKFQGASVQIAFGITVRDSRG